MSTPNPLIPQGSLHSGGTSNVRIAVATVLAIHVVFFGGLLLQGCKKDATTADSGAIETNGPSTALSLPAIDSNSLFYPSSNSLPPDAGTSAVASSTPSQPTNYLPEQPAQTSVVTQDPWKPANTIGTLTQPGAEPETTGKEYTVVRGDSFSRIAKRQGSTVSAIRKANPNVDPLKIRPGMKLIVPTVEKSEAVAIGGGAADENVYVVKSGDTLTKIAHAHGVTVGQLRSANNLRTSRVNVNQKLKIPAPATNSTKAPAPTSLNPTF